VQAGLPAIFVSDSSLSRFYPWYHQSGDTADKLDAQALGRMGNAVLGAVDALERAPRGPAAQPAWFAAFGMLAPGWLLVAAGVGSLVPGLLKAKRAGRLPFGMRVVQAALCLTLFWRHALPAVWILALPNLVTAFTRSWKALAVAALPLVSLLGLGAAAWFKEVAPGARLVAGLWLAPWELAVLALALGLSLGRLGPVKHGPRKYKLKGPKHR
jgi:hypothetical protein